MSEVGVKLFWIDLSAEEEQRAESLHKETLVIDGLVPTDVYLSEDDYRDHLYQGGVNTGNFTVASRTDYRGATSAIQHFHNLANQQAMSDRRNLYCIAQ